MVNDENEKREEPKSKKAKVEGKDGEQEAKEVVTVQKNGDGESYFELNDKRRVTVRKFRDVALIDIREMYQDRISGEMKPGKKGISLSVDQYEALKEIVQSGSLDDEITKLAVSK